jgi:hypothetical protein
VDGEAAEGRTISCSESERGREKELEKAEKMKQPRNVDK